jgi:hypothetical protein
MIPVARVPAPPGFDENVRSKGLTWIEEQRRPITKFHSLWRWCEPHLHVAFQGRCGWAAVAISSGQVEHFISQRACVEQGRPELAYDWDNFRYIMPELNCKKSRRPSVLDPFDVQPDWFELVLPQLHVRMTERIPDSHRDLARSTLDFLGLTNGPKLMRLRRKYMQQYREGKTRIALLDEDFPLLADALHRLFAADEAELDEELRTWRAEVIADRLAANATVP